MASQEETPNSTVDHQSKKEERPEFTPLKLDLQQVSLTEEMFTCTECLKVLRTPVILVDTDRNVCYSCSKQKGYEGLRNFPFENILSELKFPCQFTRFGCESVIWHSLLEIHEEECPFRIITCLCDLECPWKGIIQNYSDHVYRKHKNYVVESKVKHMFDLNLNLLDEAVSIRLLICEDKKEVYFLRYQQKDEILMYTIYRIRSTIESGVIKAQIKHLGVNSEFTTQAEIKDGNTFMTDDSFSAKINLLTLSDMGILQEDISLQIRILNSDGKCKEFDDLTAFVECPVCRIIMTKEIYICPDGHSFCQKCHLSVNQCPLCLEIFSVQDKNDSSLAASITAEKMTRNFILEKLIKDIICPYTDMF